MRQRDRITYGSGLLITKQPHTLSGRTLSWPAGAILRILSLLSLLAGLSHAAFVEADRPANSPAQIDKPYVLLISLDGYRYDYNEKHGAPNLTALGAAGVRAKALIPEFPTLTFPNHYSIATGLYPEHHGIVENSFWDPDFQASFRFTNPVDAGDGRWWGGTPLWVLAEQQGMRTAAYFWVGSEASIQGIRPSYYFIYDSKTTLDTQIDQVGAWLALPRSSVRT